MIKKVGPVDHKTDEPGRCRQNKTNVFHVNILKFWRDESDIHVMFSAAEDELDHNNPIMIPTSIPTSPSIDLEALRINPDLSEENRYQEDLGNFVKEIADSFSDNPGRMTHALH